MLSLSAISVFRRLWEEVFAVLGYCAALIGIYRRFGTPSHLNFFPVIVGPVRL